MEKILIPIAQFDTVYMINGVFSQNGTVKLAENGVIYLTVFPLSAMLLSYTVKIVGRHVDSNNEFCSIYSLNPQTDIAVLKPRNNIVYTPQKPSKSALPPLKLFEAVKQKQIQKARQLMSEELNESIDDDNLISFFEDYVDIVPSRGVDIGSDKFILCRKDGFAAYYKFEYKSGLIDDISEV